MTKFEVGDWVFEKGSNKPRCLDAQYIEEIELHGSWDDFRLWEPELNEIVWYLSVHEEAGLMRYVGKEGRYYKCKTLTGEAIFNCLCIEPFIGQLPVKIQNKLKEIKRLNYHIQKQLSIITI